MSCPSLLLRTLSLIRRLFPCHVFLTPFCPYRVALPKYTGFHTRCRNLGPWYLHSPLGTQTPHAGCAEPGVPPGDSWAWLCRCPGCPSANEHGPCSLVVLWLHPCTNYPCKHPDMLQWRPCTHLSIHPSIYLSIHLSISLVAVNCFGRSFWGPFRVRGP